jgi:hypothetical protein
MSDDFKELSIEIEANNSSGKQTLHFASQIEDGEREYYFTISGVYEGKPFQLDFDLLSKEKLEELEAMFSLIREE